MMVCVPGSCLRFGGEPRHPRGSPWTLFQRSHVGKHLYRLLFFPPSIQESHPSSPANQKPSLHTYIALSCSTRWQSALTNCNHRLNHIRISSCEKRLLSSSWLHNVGVNKGIWQSVGCKWGQLRGHWWTFAKKSGNNLRFTRWRNECKERANNRHTANFQCGKDLKDSSESSLQRCKSHARLAFPDMM